EDRSLSVKVMADAPDGFVCHSFSGDDPMQCRDYVRQRLNLPAFQPNGRRRKTSQQEIENLLAAAVDYQRKPQGTLTATYRYTDADGGLLYQVLRYDNPKRFVQRRPEGRAWVWNLQGICRVLYRLPELLKYPSGTTFIPEGEKDADN